MRVSLPKTTRTVDLRSLLTLSARFEASGLAVTVMKRGSCSWGCFSGSAEQSVAERSAKVNIKIDLILLPNEVSTAPNCHHPTCGVDRPAHQQPARQARQRSDIAFDLIDIVSLLHCRRCCTSCCSDRC